MCIRDSINGIDTKSYGSQGQQRSAVLTMKFSSLKIICLLYTSKDLVVNSIEAACSKVYNVDFIVASDIQDKEGFYLFQKHIF